jgi:hypothetical protein
VERFILPPFATSLLPIYHLGHSFTTCLLLWSRFYYLLLPTFGVRAAGAICDIPGVNFLKPVFGMVAVICDIAKAYIISPVRCDPNNLIYRLFMVTAKRHSRWPTMLKPLRIQSWIALPFCMEK